MSLEIKNYSFEHNLLEKPKHPFQPHIWLTIITNLVDNTKYSVKFAWNHEQPYNEVIFADFCDKNKFREKFSIEAEIIPEAVLVNTAPSDTKTVDIPANLPDTTDTKQIVETQENVEIKDETFVQVTS